MNIATATQPKTSFAGKSPFPKTMKKDAASLKKKPVNAPKVNVANLIIEDRPYDPDWKVKQTGSMYDPIFSQLKVGQCVVCEPDECSAVANGMRSWFRRKRGINILVKEVRKDPLDGKGRVWFYRDLGKVKDTATSGAAA